MAGIELAIHLRRTDEPTPAAQAGLCLATRLDAYVHGLHVVPIAPAAFASPEAVALQVHEAEQFYRDALTRSDWWLAELAAHGLSGEWQVAQGDNVQALCHASRWCDLLVIERPVLNPDAPTGWGVVSRTVFDACAPTLVVPEPVRTDCVGRSVVIAWNGSREAILAIRGALPVLRRAERVTVLEGEAADNPFGLRHLPAPDLRGWFARAGVRAEYHEFRPSTPVGPAILDAAHALDADLVVMGAWGRSRVSELVLGGATRHLFQSSDLPLLVAH